MLTYVVGAVIVIFPVAVTVCVGLHACRSVGSLFAKTDV